MRFPGSAVVFCVLMVLGTGCGAPSTSPGPTADEPTVASEIDPRWMGLGTGDEWDWEIISRTITRDFQQFRVRPKDDTDEFSKDYNGCGCGPATTASLTVHAPANFDPTQARSNQPVSVNGGEGFFLPADESRKATLSWSYAPDAWATIDGFSVTMKALDRLQELAGFARPSERTPARLPLSLGRLPASMPLSSIQIQGGQFPTIVRFGACQPHADGTLPKDCTDANSRLKVEIWPSDDYPEYSDGADGRRELYNIPVTIGGLPGFLHERGNAAAVKVRPGMVVVFAVHGSTGPVNAELNDVLAGVTWASDPADEVTWPAVTDWVS